MACGEGGGAEGCAAKDVARPLCAATGACVACEQSGQCAAAAEPICDEAAGTCRGCEGGPECAARDAAAPVCRADGQCVACDDDGDCASEVCDEGAGTCVAAGAIVYVDAGGGADGSGCGSAASPCQTIGGPTGALAKVAAGRATVKVRAGTYAEAVVIDGLTVAVVAPGAEVVPTLIANSPGLLVRNVSDVTVEGLTLRDASGGSNADGIRCDVAGDPAAHGPARPGLVAARRGLWTEPLQPKLCTVAGRQRDRVPLARQR